MCDYCDKIQQAKFVVDTYWRDMENLRDGYSVTLGPLPDNEQHILAKMETNFCPKCGQQIKY